jgi:hypothetical protein
MSSTYETAIGYGRCLKPTDYEPHAIRSLGNFNWGFMPIICAGCLYPSVKTDGNILCPFLKKKRTAPSHGSLSFIEWLLFFPLWG